MQAIRVFSYVCFGFAALSVLLAIVENPLFLVNALVLLVGGVLYLALDKIITTLIEI